MKGTRRSLSRSKSSLFKRSASMEPPIPSSNSSAYVPATAASASTGKIEFPSSPQSEFGEEIIHYTHSKHPLTLVTLSEIFMCSGCKEYGAGKRFTCQQCDFQLHEFCASSPPLLNNHPLHGQHQLVFHAKPKPVKGGISWPKCDVCGKSTKGFTFRCSACSFQMHPCCAMLSTQVSFALHPHPLKLLPPSSAGGGDTGIVCGRCKKKRSGRIYSCTVCDYHLHAVCAKDLINGLQANGFTAPEKPNMLGTAARVASQVVVEFIGGLIEGLGEGMGDALVQSITRSNNRQRNGRRRALQ